MLLINRKNDIPFVKNKSTLQLLSSSASFSLGFAKEFLQEGPACVWCSPFSDGDNREPLMQKECCDSLLMLGTGWVACNGELGKKHGVSNSGVQTEPDTSARGRIFCIRKSIDL